MIGVLQRVGGRCEPIRKIKGSLLPEQVQGTSFHERSVVGPGRPRYKAMDLLESERDRAPRGHGNQGGTAKYIRP